MDEWNMATIEWKCPKCGKVQKRERAEVRHVKKDDVVEIYSRTPCEDCS